MNYPLAAVRPRPSRVWSPLDLGLAFLWEGEGSLYQDIARTTLAVSESDPVGSITDLTGNGNHFAAVADDTTRPALNLTGPNSTRIVNSDGVNDILIAPSITSTDGMTLWGVFRAETTIVGCPFISGSQSANWRIYCNSGGLDEVRMNTSAGISSIGAAMTIDQWYIVIGRYRVSDALQSVILDGVKYDEKSTGTGTPVTGEPRFLCRVASSPASSAAAGIVTRYLSDAECNQLGQYLKSKYNPTGAASGPQWVGL